MYFYLLWYGSYEDSGKISLTHTEEFDKKQFEDKVVKATVELLVNRRGDYNFLYADEGEIAASERAFLEKCYEEGTVADDIDYSKTTKEDYVQKFADKYYTHFSEIYVEVANLMCEMFGFKILNYTQETGCDGWGGIVDPNRHFGQDDDLLNSIAKQFWEIKKK